MAEARAPPSAAHHGSRRARGGGQEKRNRLPVENTCGDRLAAAATTLKSERAVRSRGTDERPITQLWAAELAFEAEADMRRETRDARGDGESVRRWRTVRRAATSGARTPRTDFRRSDERETRRDENEAFRCDETRFVTTDERTETPRPPSRRRGRGSRRAIVAMRARTGPGARCDAGASHGTAECDALSEALKNTTFAAPRALHPPAGIYRRRKRASRPHGVSVGTSPDERSDGPYRLRARRRDAVPAADAFRNAAWFDGREPAIRARRGAAELRRTAGSRTEPSEPLRVLRVDTWGRVAQQTVFVAGGPREKSRRCSRRSTRPRTRRDAR